MAIDYFTKWVEIALYKVLNSKKVTQFIQTNIICWYRIPHEIISDYGLHFKGEVEAANKNIGQILKNNMKNYRDWHL